MMFLATLFSTFCLLAASPSIDIIRQNHLDTPERRVTFLEDQLTPYATSAEQINQEIQALSEKITALSPHNDQEQIIASTQEMTQKMDQLLIMLPVLNMALSIDEDLQQIDAILDQTDPLSSEQEQIIDRVSSLCNLLPKI